MHAAGSCGTDPPPRLRTGVERSGRGADNVKAKREIFFRLFVALLLLAAMSLLVFLQGKSDPDRGYDWNRIKIEEDAIAGALKHYSYEYGVFPAGNTESVERILAGENLNGKNPRQIHFLNFRPSIEHSNEMVDPWETPYAIDFFPTNSYVISSAGKNKVFGDADDVIFNSLSNDFVKP